MRKLKTWSERFITSTTLLSRDINDSINDVNEWTPEDAMDIKFTKDTLTTLYSIIHQIDDLVKHKTLLENKYTNVAIRQQEKMNIAIERHQSIYDGIKSSMIYIDHLMALATAAPSHSSPVTKYISKEDMRELTIMNSRILQPNNH